MDRHAELIRLAVRIWTAAESLDALHGTGEKVWRWTHREVAKLGKDPDPDEVRKLVAVLERRLAADRGREVEA